MLALIDRILDRTTMYRLVLYYVLSILAVAVVLAFFGLLNVHPMGIIISAAFLTVICFVVNHIFAWAYDAPLGTDSVYITALILACIITPVAGVGDLWLLFWAGTLAMASKYILAIGKKHLFNPAAIAVVLTALWLHQSASWWVGTTLLAPVIVVGGLLTIRKLRRTDLVLAFFVMAILTIAYFVVGKHGDLLGITQRVILQSSFLFFGFVMLTEPFTTPPGMWQQILYGGLVGILFAPQIHYGSTYSTPELALVVGNIFSYLVSPKGKQRLSLREKIQLSSDTYEFVFQPERDLNFKPGQYVEITVPHKGVDARGNRRYFTLASSPTEKTVKFGVKFYPEGSSFKKSLSALEPGSAIMAGQLSGGFTLPKNSKEKLVFVAGGIGITPFRSMVKYLQDKGEYRDVILLYGNKKAEEIAYRELFESAAESTGLRTVYVLSDAPPPDWTGRTGFIAEQTIQEEVPDYKERTFYISGPHIMVTKLEEALKKLGVPDKRIKKDFFPGLV